MKMKTVRARNIQDAIKAIKQSLGSDAVIMSSKNIVLRKGFLGIGQVRGVEVVAAIEVTSQQMAARSANKRQKIPTESLADRPIRLRESLPRPVSRSTPAPPAVPPPSGTVTAAFEERLAASMGELPAPLHHPEVDLLRMGHEPSAGECVNRPGALPAGAARTQTPTVFPTPPPDRNEGWLQHIPQLLAAEYRTWVANGCHPMTARRFMTLAHDWVGTLPGTNQEVIRGALRRLVLREVRISPPIAGAVDVRKVILVTGASGSGKTTALLRWGKQYACVEHRSVQLIHVEQGQSLVRDALNAKGQEWHLRVDHVPSLDAALTLCEQAPQVELILVEVPSGTECTPQQYGLVRQLTQKGRQVETYITVQAGIREQDLARQVSRYQHYPHPHLMISKADETRNYWPVFEIMAGSGLPLGYLSHTGDWTLPFVPLTPERLVDLLIKQPHTDPQPSCATPAFEPASVAKPVGK